MDKTSYLVRQMKNGDKQAFAELYNDYSGAIYGVIIKMIKDEGLANDLLQEVFIKVWQKIGQYNEDKGRFYTWVYRIARNTTINKIRSSKPENHTGDFSVYEHRLNTENLHIDALDLRGKVGSLDQKYKEVVELIYFQGYTHQQVHDLLDIPMGTIKTRLRRALQKLSTIYGHDAKILITLLIICGYA